MKELTKTLRWIAKNDEFPFNAETANQAADAIEKLQAELQSFRVELTKALMERNELREENAQLRKERDAAVDCILKVEEQFDRGCCHNDYAEQAIAEWRGMQDNNNK